VQAGSLLHHKAADDGIPDAPTSLGQRGARCTRCRIGGRHARARRPLRRRAPPATRGHRTGLPDVDPRLDLARGSPTRSRPAATDRHLAWSPTCSAATHPDRRDLHRSRARRRGGRRRSRRQAVVGGSARVPRSEPSPGAVAGPHVACRARGAGEACDGLRCWPPRYGSLLPVVHGVPAAPTLDSFKMVKQLRPARGQPAVPQRRRHLNPGGATS
jgi:hypothetical protein